MNNQHSKLSNIKFNVKKKFIELTQVFEICTKNKIDLFVCS